MTWRGWPEAFGCGAARTIPCQAARPRLERAPARTSRENVCPVTLGHEGTRRIVVINQLALRDRTAAPGNGCDAKDHVERLTRRKPETVACGSGRSDGPTCWLRCRPIRHRASRRVLVPHPRHPPQLVQPRLHQRDLVLGLQAQPHMLARRVRAEHAPATRCPSCGSRRAARPAPVLAPRRVLRSIRLLLRPEDLPALYRRHGLQLGKGTSAPCWLAQRLNASQ